MQNSLPPGVTVAKADNLEQWEMDIRVLDDNPIYKDETYRLRFTFSKNYPIGLSVCLLRLIVDTSTNDVLLWHARSSRSSIHLPTSDIRDTTPDTDASSHIQQRDHMSGSTRFCGMVTYPVRRERLHEYPKHADGQH